MAQGNVLKKSSAAAKMAAALRKKKAAANKHGRGGMTTKRGEEVADPRERRWQKRKGISVVERQAKNDDKTTETKKPRQSKKKLTVSPSYYSKSKQNEKQKTGKFVRPPKKLDLVKKATEEKVKINGGEVFFVCVLLFFCPVFFSFLTVVSFLWARSSPFFSIGTEKNFKKNNRP